MHKAKKRPIHTYRHTYTHVYIHTHKHVHKARKACKSTDAYASHIIPLSKCS